MNTLKLSINLWFFQLTEMCVDWFMNLFADPEYYWTEETLPEKHPEERIIINDIHKKTPINEISLKRTELSDNRLSIEYVVKKIQKMNKLFSLYISLLKRLVNPICNTIFCNYLYNIIKSSKLISLKIFKMKLVRFGYI